jgi:hypothetical protein
MPAPLGYFITFTCYGRWLHGDPRGSVDRDHNTIGEPWLGSSHGMLRESAEALTQPPYELDGPRRTVVLEAIVNTCRHRKWNLFAAHVRTWHVHLVMAANATPEKVMSDLKAYAIRALNQHRFDATDRKRWTRHGSTRYLNSCEHMERAIEYVLFEQGSVQSAYDGRNG